MKITHNKVGQNLNLRDTAKTDKSDKLGAASAPLKDVKANAADTNATGVEATKVNLSDRAQDIKRAKDIAMAAQDVNQEKVARLQKLIDEGKYSTDAKEIASKMVDEHLSWE